MEVIVPAAGLSTRFPGLKPKYLLEDNSKTLMIHKAVRNYIGKYRVIIGILKQHDIEHNSSNILRSNFGNLVDIVVIENNTKGPADTVNEIIKLSGLNDGEMLIRDCDSYFDHDNKPGNYICTASAREHMVLFNLAAKSFVVANNQDIVTDIVEKQVISDLFCTGGYKFNSSLEYVKYYEKLKTVKEYFVSDVIQLMLLNKHIFTTSSTSNYHDVGTLEAWMSYNKET